MNRRDGNGHNTESNGRESDHGVTRVVLRRVGERVGAELPSEMVAKYGLQPGDEVFVMEADEGIYLAPTVSAFHQAYRDYEASSRRYHETIADLSRG